jgi:DNA polymerase III delta subunit
MVITLTGVNDFGRSAELRRIVAEFLKENDEMGLERVDGEEAEVARIQEAITSLPFLVPKKLVVLQRPGSNKKFAEQIEQIFAQIPEETEVIIVEPKLDKRLSYYKFLKKSTDYREFNDLDSNGLARWLVGAAKALGAMLNSTDAAFLVQRVGVNQQMLANELEKLSLYDPKITRVNIQLLTEPNPQSTIFELIEAAFAGNAKRAMQLYDEQRVQKVEPPQIVAMLTWQLHVLSLVKTAGQRSAQDIAKVAKLNPYVVQRSIIAARSLSATDLKKRVADLLELDVRMKSEPIDADDALKAYILGM